MVTTSPLFLLCFPVKGVCGVSTSTSHGDPPPVLCVVGRFETLTILPLEVS